MAPDHRRRLHGGLPRRPYRRGRRLADDAVPHFRNWRAAGAGGRHRPLVRLADKGERRLASPGARQCRVADRALARDRQSAGRAGDARLDLLRGARHARAGRADPQGARRRARRQRARHCALSGTAEVRLARAGFHGADRRAPRPHGHPRSGSRRPSRADLGRRRRNRRRGADSALPLAVGAPPDRDRHRARYPAHVPCRREPFLDGQCRPADPGDAAHRLGAWHRARLAHHRARARLVPAHCAGARALLGRVLAAQSTAPATEALLPEALQPGRGNLCGRGSADPASRSRSTSAWKRLPAVVART